MYVRLGCLCSIVLPLMFIGCLAASEHSEDSTTRPQGGTFVSNDILYVAGESDNTYLRGRFIEMVKNAPVEDKEILAVVYSFYPAMSLDASETATAKFSQALILFLSSVEVSLQNLEGKKEAIRALDKPYTNLKKLQTVLSLRFLWRDEIQTEVVMALYAQSNLIDVLAESWAWRNHLANIVDPVMRSEAARAVRQEPAPNKLTVAYAWKYIFARIKDKQIRQETNEAVARVSFPDKLFVAEIWKDHIQTILDPVERTSAWCVILLSLDQTEARPAIARRLEVLEKLKKIARNPLKNVPKP